MAPPAPRRGGQRRDGRRGDLPESSFRARYLGLCEFAPVPLPPPVDPTHRRTLAEKTVDSLSAMRRRIAADVDAQVFVGGKIHGWSGRLPGLGEELLTSLRSARRPAILLVGGFGGCAKLLADYLTGPSDDLPDELTYDAELAARKKKPRAERWPADAPSEAATRAAYAELHDGLRAFRTEVGAARPTGTVRDVPYPLWASLCGASSPTRVLKLVMDALAALGAPTRA